MLAPTAPILLLGRCGLSRLAAPLAALTGAEVVTGPWTGVALAERLQPALVYVDLFDWDRVGPLVSSSLGGVPATLDPAERAALATVIAALRPFPTVYRGLRRPLAGAFGLLEGEPPALREALDALAALVAGERVLDVAGLWARHGLVSDEVLHGLGHGEALITPGGARPWELEAGFVAALWRARTRGPLKVAVVDLDETLIHGELASDDFAALNPAYLPEGEAPRAGVLEGWWRLRRGLHEALRVVAGRGVLLALATRNDPALVRRRLRVREALGDEGPDPGPYAWMYADLPPELREAAFARHPALLRRLALGLDDFVHVEAGFGPKSEMCRKIAETLGVGLDSLALLDDSPYERAEVQANAPEVTVLQGPVEGFREQLLNGPLFTVWEPSAARRVESYRSRAAVVRAAADPDGLTGFLHGLEMRLVVRPAAPSDLPRVRELLQRGNQLDLTGARPEIVDARGVQVALLRDRLADHGLVAAGVVRDGRLVAWVCSCRVLPHGVAPTILHQMLAAAPGTLAARVETGRNGATLGLLEAAAAGPAPWVTVEGGVSDYFQTSSSGGRIST